MVDTIEAAPKKRVLIVEDEPLIALALESTLAEFGFEVAATATRISTALEAIDREEIDGAILDVNLGSQRIDAVADALAARGCPFFFMTGYGALDVPPSYSGRTVLQKPFRLEQFLAALRSEFGLETDSPCGIETGSRSHPDRCPTPGL